MSNIFNQVIGGEFSKIAGVYVGQEQEFNSDATVTELVNGRKSADFSTLHMDIGDMVHAALAKFFKNNEYHIFKFLVNSNKPLEIRAAIAEFTSSLNDDLKKILTNKYLESLILAIKKDLQFDEDEGLYGCRFTLDVEEPIVCAGDFNKKISRELNIGGTPDVVLTVSKFCEENGDQHKVYVLDFKTSKLNKPSTSWFEQCLMYAEMSRAKYFPDDKYYDESVKVVCAIANMGPGWENRPIVQVMIDLDVNDDQYINYIEGLKIRMSTHASKLFPNYRLTPKNIIDLENSDAERFTKLAQRYLDLKEEIKYLDKIPKDKEAELREIQDIFFYYIDEDKCGCFIFENDESEILPYELTLKENPRLTFKVNQSCDSELNGTFKYNITSYIEVVKNNG